MSPAHRNPFIAFYRALAPLGRWPRRLLIGILLYSLAAMLALAGYALTGPTAIALSAALGNIVSLWAIGFFPATILMLTMRGRANPRIWRSWIGRLLYAGMIGAFAACLWLMLSLNTMVPIPRSWTAWAFILLSACLDAIFLGVILLLPRVYWRRWSMWLWLVAMVGLMLSISYQAAATAEPSVSVPVLMQAASAVQSVCYVLAIMSFILQSVRSMRMLGSRRQISQPPPSQ